MSHRDPMTGRSTEDGTGAGGHPHRHSQDSILTDSQVSSQLNNLVIDEGSSSDYTDDDGEEFGDMHRLVLQCILASGWMNAKGVKKLFQESCKLFQCK